MKKFLLSIQLLILMLNSFSALAQSHNIDKLKEQLSICPTNDNEYVDLLNELAHSYYQRNIDSVFSYAEKAKLNAENIKYTTGIAWACVHLGYAYNRKSMDSLSIAYLHKSLSLFSEVKDNKGLAYTNNLLGIYYYFQSDYNKASSYYEKAVDQYKKSNDQLGLSRVYNNLGVISKKNGHYGKSIDYYKQALLTQELLGDSLGMSDIYNNIAIVYKILNDFDEALLYYNKSLIIKKKYGVTKSIANTSMNIGLLYLVINDPQEAYHYILYSVKLIRSSKQVKDLPQAFNALGRCYILLEKYDSAEYVLNKSLKLLTNDYDIKDEAWANWNLGFLNYSKGEYAKSIYYTTKAYDFGQRSGNIDILKESTRILAKNNEELNEYKAALSFNQLYTKLSDSIARSDAAKKLAALEYQQEKNRINNKLIQQTLKLEVKKKQVRLITIILGLIFVSVVLGAIQYFRIKKKNKILFNKNLELTKAEQNAEKQKAFKSTRKLIESYSDSEPDARLLESLNLLILQEKCYTDTSLTLES